MLVRGENMIKTYAMLLSDYSDYIAPDNKIAREVKEGKYIKIVKGIYETDRNTPGYSLASVIYGPSYLSFDFALAYYDLIPEGVYTYTSATFEKKKTKKYSTSFGNFRYRDVPSDVFPLGVHIINEGGYFIRIASPEKALCDKLYALSPIRSKKEMRHLLFEDLRLDENLFEILNKQDLMTLCDL